MNQSWEENMISQNINACNFIYNVVCFSMFYSYALLLLLYVYSCLMLFIMVALYIFSM